MTKTKPAAREPEAKASPDGSVAPAAMDAATADETEDRGKATAMGAITPRGGALHHEPAKDDPVQAERDIVEVASDESFPASDPPSYSRRTADDD
jgi:hypothetical protein